MSVIRLLNSSSRRALFPGATVALDFTKGQYRLPVGASWSVTRSSIGYAETEAGLLVPFGVNEMRRTDKGLLVEESRTNEWTASFDPAPSSIWPTLVSATVSAGTLPSRAPGATSTLITTTGANGRAQRNVTTTSGTATRTYSVDVEKKSVTYEISAGYSGGTTVAALFQFNGLTGVVTSGTGTVEDKGSWWRVSKSATDNATGNNLFFGYVMLAGASGQTAHVSIPQVEAGSFATSYIPTTSASATRAADVTHLALGSTAAEGTVVASIIWPAALASGNPRIIGQHGTSSTPISLDTSGAQVISFNGTAALNHLVSATTSGTVFTAAMRWSAAGRGVSAKGATPSTDVNLIGTFNDMALGYQGIGTTALNGYIRRAIIYPRAFTDAELQAATT